MYLSAVAAAAAAEAAAASQFATFVKIICVLSLSPQQRILYRIGLNTTAVILIAHGAQKWLTQASSTTVARQIVMLGATLMLSNMFFIDRQTSRMTFSRKNVMTGPASLRRKSH